MSIERYFMLWLTLTLKSETFTNRFSHFKYWEKLKKKLKKNWKYYSSWNSLKMSGHFPFFSVRHGKLPWNFAVVHATIPSIHLEFLFQLLFWMKLTRCSGPDPAPVIKRLEQLHSLGQLDCSMYNVVLNNWAKRRASVSFVKVVNHMMELNVRKFDEISSYVKNDSVI